MGRRSGIRAACYGLCHSSRLASAAAPDSPGLALHLAVLDLFSTERSDKQARKTSCHHPSSTHVLLCARCSPEEQTAGRDIVGRPWPSAGVYSCLGSPYIISQASVRITDTISKRTSATFRSPCSEYDILGSTRQLGWCSYQHFARERKHRRREASPSITGQRQTKAVVENPCLCI